MQKKRTSYITLLRSNAYSSIVISSKFISGEAKQDISLHHMGEFLNTLIFAESQLQVRLSSMINQQNAYQHSIESLQSEFSELKNNFTDSEFIERYHQKHPYSNI